MLHKLNSLALDTSWHFVSLFFHCKEVCVATIGDTMQGMSPIGARFFHALRKRRQGMKCEKCGTEFEGNFCPNCGTPSEAGKNICPRCGQARSGADRFCKNCGYDFHQSEKSLKTSAATAGGAAAAIKRVPKKVWIRIAIALAVVAVLLAVLIPTISHFTNKFRIGVVEQISIGDSKERVIELLGEPYNYNADSATFEYYSDNYLKLLEENDSFNPDDIEDWDDFENAFDDALALEEKLQTEEYSYIRVTFDRDGNVASVLLDASRTEQTKNAAKEVGRAVLLTDDIENFIQAYSDGTLTYCAQYEDGSYFLGPVSANEIDATMFLWTDIYGNRCQWNMGFNWDNGWYETENEAGEKTIYVFGNNVEIPQDATSVVILDSVTSIADDAFCNRGRLTSVVIGNGITSIGDSAFSGCGNLTSVTIGNGVTSIESETFTGCSSLTSIEIPDSVTSIANGAFEDTEYYNDEVNWENGVLYIGNHLIKAHSTLSGIYSIRNGTKALADSAFYECGDLTGITIPASVTSIGYEAFFDCWRLKSVTFGVNSQLTSIGDSAFSGCRNLISIEIPNGVTSIGDYAFDGCHSLTSITFGDNSNLISIGDSAFSGCGDLSSIGIPDGVTNIGDEAFYYCSSLTSITIPDGVTSIGDSAFSDCGNLTSVTIGNGVTSIGDSAFA